MSDFDERFFDEFDSKYLADAQQSPDINRYGSVLNDRDDPDCFNNLRSPDELDKESVRQASERLKIIIQVGKSLVGGWTQKNLDPVLDELYNKGVLKERVSWRSVARWKSLYDPVKGLASLVSKNKLSKNKKPYESSLVDEMVYKAIDTKYLTKERVSVSSAYQYYCDLVEIANKSVASGKFNPVSDSTFRRVVKSLSPYQVMLHRYGKRYADKHYREIGKFKKATRVMERVEIDHTPLDLILLDDELQIPLGRPYLTMLVDCYSKCIVGFHLGYREPSYDAVRKALLSACLSKEEIKIKYPGIINDWPCEGKIETLVVDNGAEFWSESLEHFCQAIGMNIEYNPVAKPWKKPLVERIFSTYKSVLIDHIPGKTFSNVQQLKDYKPDKDAVMPFSLFVELLYKWVVDIYNYSANSRETNIPILAWESGFKDLPPVCYTGLERDKFILESLPVCKRTLKKEGVLIDHIAYCSDELVDYRKNTPPAIGSSKVEVSIKRDPSDISKIYVYLPEQDKYIKVLAVDPDEELQGVSIFEHQTHIKFTRLYNRSKVDRLALAESRQYIEQRTQEAIEAANNSAKAPNRKLLGGKRLAKLNDVSSSGNSSVVREEAKASMASAQSKVSNETESHKALDSEVLEDWDDWADDMEPY